MSKIRNHMPPPPDIPPGRVYAPNGCLSVDSQHFDKCMPAFKRRFLNASVWHFKKVPRRPMPLACVRKPCVRVAVHVRRGDVVPKAATELVSREIRGSRWVPDSHFVRLFGAVRECMPSTNFEFHVFSEKLWNTMVNYTFAAFEALNATMHLDGEPAVALELMARMYDRLRYCTIRLLPRPQIRADVLLMSPSTFSWLAAVHAQGKAVVMLGKRAWVRLLPPMPFGRRLLRLASDQAPSLLLYMGRVGVGRGQRGANQLWATEGEAADLPH
jgi:hypothetical protein